MSRNDAVAGVLPVDKPTGPTSHDIVAMTRRSLGTRQVGHTGTLDPFASGLLLLCIGRATRIAEYLTGLPKQYRATLRLGQSTDTDDPTGRVLQETETWRDIGADQVAAVLERWRGDIMQVPSTFSAKKRGGERAYQAAREGRAVELQPVSVRIDRLEMSSFDPPFVGIDVTCSSGTYIRALARDIGVALGVGAHLTVLRRSAIGPHHVDRALAVTELADPARVSAVMLTPLEALTMMPRIDIDDAQADRIRFGQALARPHEPGLVALAAHGELVAIGESDGERIQPRKVFAA